MIVSLMANLAFMTVFYLFLGAGVSYLRSPTLTPSSTMKSGAPARLHRVADVHHSS
jgi:hypothetical protein